MPQLTPAQMKEHLLVPASFTDDDVQIAGFIEAAEDHIERYLRRDMAVDFPDGWPATAVQAIRLMVANMYAHRGFEAEEDDRELMTPMVKSILSHLRSLA